MTNEARTRSGETATRAAAGAGRGAASPHAGRRPFIRDLFSRELLRYLGPGFVVTIGFIDPGNWATNIAGGSQFGYQLLWVISASTLMLIFLQHMAARLGIVTGSSLAVNIRRHFSRPVVWLLGGTIVPALRRHRAWPRSSAARSGFRSCSASPSGSAPRSRW